MVYVQHFIGTRDRRDALLDLLRIVGPGVPCIPWPWTRNPQTYVRVSMDGVPTHAHRWVWEQINGPVPEGMEVCHSCPLGDSPSCVRPSHLWTGTHSQNILDGYAKGRIHGNTKNHSSGESHWAARLTTEDVYRIRRLVDGGAIQLRLATEYGVSRVTINHIARRKTWRHLPEETDQSLPAPAAQA